jgi:serine/threonine protein phosphatase PrpC
VGVSSEPDTLQLELTPADKFLVLGSDGIWEFITNAEAVAIVGACETVEEACRQLVEEAHNRWLVEEEGVVDDITAVVVQLIHG